MELIDTHCHLTSERFADDLDEVVERAAAAGVERMVTIGTGVEDARRALELCERFADRVWAAVGIDPFHAHELDGAGFDAALGELAGLLEQPRVVALGEVGLDFHYDLDPPELQRERCARQLAMAVERDLPAVLHVREAHAEMADLLAGHPECRGVVHSFTGGPAEAERYLDLGWHLAFNGIVTFRNAAALREAAARVPEERLLVETDSPYLAPVPRRGKRCEPALVRHTLERVAEVRGVEAAGLAAATSANARRLFGLTS